MHQYVFGLIHRGPTWTPNTTPELDQLQRDHLANIARLAEEGSLALAGPFTDGGELRGIFIFNVETTEEALALVDSDPAVQSGRLVVELHPYYGPDALATVAASEETPRG